MGFNRDAQGIEELDGLPSYTGNVKVVPKGGFGREEGQGKDVLPLVCLCVTMCAPD